MIGEKIIKIMQDIQPIIKTDVINEDGKSYKAAKAEEIISMVQPLLIKNRVIILPVKVVNFSTQGNKIYMTMKYQFIDVEDPQKDCIEVEIPASGFDEKGRAVFAALTGAYRYAMQEVLAIPVVDEIRSGEENNTNKDDNSNIDSNMDNTTANNENNQSNSEEELSIDQLDALFSSEKVA